MRTCRGVQGPCIDLHASPMCPGHYFKSNLTWPMGNRYLFLRCLAKEVDQMMKPEMTSRTASRVVTMIDKDPLTAAMLTRTINSTLHSHNTAVQIPSNHLRMHSAKGHLTKAHSQ